MRVDWSRILHLTIKTDPKRVLRLAVVSLLIFSLSSLMASLVVVEMTFNTFYAVVTD